MSLSNVLAGLRADPRFMENVASWRTLRAQPAAYAPLPDRLHPALQQGLAARGIAQLYTHQARATDLALSGQHVAVVTPTASGKTLCYNLPILHEYLSDPDVRALYLFPTKALAQDQLAELRTWLQMLTSPSIQNPKSIIHNSLATYDGDTPTGERSRIRKQARLLLTNPDMLHTGILPYHSNWEQLFSRLRYVVIDEMHTYRGVFGSHVANVLRRLQRICAFYGSRPSFICTSATIANPRELAERLVEQTVTVVEENGAPRGEKHIILYNPPVYDPARGLRQSSTLAAHELAATCVLGGVQTIVFGRSRLTTELLLTYLRERVARTPDLPTGDLSPAAIRGYRGGYLPAERRAIEAGLRSGAVRGVVATNALELGIDIGQLQAAVLCGYPGTIASTWQQMGRAGRTREASLAILVATGGALDQYVIRHPEFIFERSPEHALINADNLMLLVDQLRCAAFELPFTDGEAFGHSPYTADVLELLAEQGDVQRQAGRSFWTGTGYPGRAISLRSTGAATVAVQAEPPAGAVEIIGQIDQPSAPRLVHDGAVYLHEGQSFQVTRLDLEANLAHVQPVHVDYYTDAIGQTEVEVLVEHEARQEYGAIASHGDLRVSQQVLGYRRVKRFTHETLGVFPLNFPPQVVETTGYWFTVTPEAQASLEQAGQWHDSINEYGPNWEEQRQLVRARDGYRCTQCGAAEPPGRQHDVHHLVPFRVFGYVPGLNRAFTEANRLDNLILVCRTCHQRLEVGVRVRSGLDGLAYALGNLAPLYLMCDVEDIGVHVVRADRPSDPQSIRAVVLPTVFIYERAAAGLGFSARLFELHSELLVAAHDLISHCPCPSGCPACVGPILEHELAQLETKQLTLALLAALRGHGDIGAPALRSPPLTDVDFTS